MLFYRELETYEAERISEIDAFCYIKRAWRMNEKGEYRLEEIDWTDMDLPNGFDWHLERLQETMAEGGKAFGCFDDELLVGYASMGSRVFGEKEKYVLLDQLFVSSGYRGLGIGRSLVNLCSEEALEMGGEKLYLCAGSSEDTIAFFQKLGCVYAMEIDRELFEEDPDDIQLELKLPRR